jgi:hypothetical protein
LCTGHQVTTLQDERNGLRLNRGRRLVAEFGDGAQEGLDQAELFKFGIDDVLLRWFPRCENRTLYALAVAPARTL